MADGDEALVRFRLSEADETDGRAALAGLPVLGYAGAFQQQMENVLVVLRQIAAGEAGGALLDDLFALVVFEPGLNHL